MTETHASGRPAPLPLSDLFTRYLKRQAAAHAQGLGYPEPADEVVPHEAVQVQPVDPQRAWDDALAVVRYFLPAALPADVTVPDWPGLVQVQEPAVALAFCLGNYPQMVRNLHPLLAGDLLSVPGARLRQAPGRSSSPLRGAPALAEWAAHFRDYPQLLLAAGVLRLARHFDEARDLLRRVEDAPAPWQAVRANEEAALAWHAGRDEEALALWQKQEASVPVHFNRGMAALFLGQPALARLELTQAVAALPETSAWYHLGHLYLTLTE